MTENTENTAAKLIVYPDDEGEIQIKMTGPIHPRLARLMLQVAAAKLELLDFGLMLEAQTKPDIAIARAVPKLG